MLEKENLEAKVDILERISSKGIVPGAVFDCIVFHDGENWRYKDMLCILSHIAIKLRTCYAIYMPQIID